MSAAVVSIVPITFALALLAPTFSTRVRGRGTPHIQTWTLAVVVGAMFGVLLSYFPQVEEGAIIYNVPWVPELGLGLSLYFDGLSMMFALLITGVGVAIVLFAGYYFDEVEDLGRFYGLLMLFMGSMLGLVLSGNVLTLFICWELTSFISFGLIGFNGKSAEARKSALRALIITAGGGLALVAGLLLMGTAVGSYEMADILSSAGLLREHPWYTAFTVLILIGCFSKSAQFPLHFWLPGAMTAPTPASAYLHSATMVKAGIYLLLRLYPVLANTPLWTTWVVGIGFFTFVMGAWTSLSQNDLKAILAYLTVSKLGAIVGLIGLPEAIGIKAALIGILAHALYKATLFMVAGSIDHATGTRDYRSLGGLARHFPWLTGLAIVAGLSMAGAPLPLLGFVSKETLIDAALHSPYLIPVTAAAVLGSVFTVAAAIVLVWDVFFGQARDESLHPHALPSPIATGPVLLSAGTLIFALMLHDWIQPLLEPTVPKQFELHLLPTAETLPAFGLSLLALGLGTVVFLTRGSWRKWRIPLPSAFNIYDSTIRTIEWFGDLLLQVQNGKLRYYLVVILGTFSLIMAIAGIATVVPQDALMFRPVELRQGEDVVRLVLIFVAIASAAGTIVFKKHLLAALSLGLLGYAVGGVFLLEPAPDVALITFLVETLATVLVIVMLGRIDDRQRSRSMQRLWGQTRRGIIRDVIISTIIGLMVSAFALAAVLNRPERTTIAEWHLEHAEEETGATDVVAAILTDFRGTDTLIEITVFSVAGVGVLTLLSTFQRSIRVSQGTRNPLESSIIPATDEETIERFDSALSTPFTRVVARLIMPFALLISLSHILFGAEAPGDGFSAGIVSGLAVALWYVVFGYTGARNRLFWVSPGRLIGLGMFVAVANAAYPLLIGQPFLAHLTPHGLELPAQIHVASSTIFEIAIFLAVFGSVGTIMEAIAHPREVEQL